MKTVKKVKILLCLCMICIAYGGRVYAQEPEPAEQEIVDTTNHIYTFAEMECDLAELSQRYENKMICMPIGTSLDSRAIWEVIIGNPQAPKAIFIEAAVHGREWMNSWILMKQLEEIMRNWETPIAQDIELGDIFEQCAVYMIPMVNPDGVTISQCGIEAIQNDTLRVNLYQLDGAKNPARWKANAAGVDINRNFITGWKNKGIVSKPSSQCYGGAFAFSEPETVAIATAFTQRRYDAAVSYHSMEGAIYWNIGQSGELLDETAELAIVVSQLTGYSYGEQSVINGLDYNWMMIEQNTPTVLIETGTVACPLPYSQWQEIWNRNKDMIKYLATIYATK